jgi:hypothetical protein
LSEASILANFVETLLLISGLLADSISLSQRGGSMMGPTQEARAASFYEVLLDNHVRQDHLLYAIDQFVDLNDIRQYLAEFYSHTRRPSVARQGIEDT